MGPGKHENVGNSQSVLVMIHPIISTRTRSLARGNAPARCPTATPHAVSDASCCHAAGAHPCPVSLPRPCQAAPTTHALPHAVAWHTGTRPRGQAPVRSPGASGHGQCVSISLDKNRRHIGQSQSTRPPKRTQRPPHPRREQHRPPEHHHRRLSAATHPVAQPPAQTNKATRTPHAPPTGNTRTRRGEAEPPSSPPPRTPRGVCLGAD
jgi:hypothetical protein